MPFYDAIKYILTTANGKIRRKSWLKGYYVCRKFEGRVLKIILMMPYDNSTASIHYEAKTHDMIATDWEIMEE